MQISKKEILKALENLVEVLQNINITYSRDTDPETVNKLVSNYGEICYVGGLVDGLIDVIKQDEEIIGG